MIIYDMAMLKIRHIRCDICTLYLTKKYLPLVWNGHNFGQILRKMKGIQIYQLF